MADARAGFRNYRGQSDHTDEGEPAIRMRDVLGFVDFKEPVQHEANRRVWKY